ncbi:protein phosphatase 2C 70-like isoform X1 [Triticum dicoccoides]|uniref:protein phosphatase 2C 70-like isoform X1 n=1 Tax=Triticum dicoccoides TaxID=85692 RepID=UPI00189020E4|nr:protein phosphatase 2C 70-like isoform X1 [Triticum dicoccoides]
MAISPLVVSGAAVATLAVLGLAVYACRRWCRGAPPAAPPPASSSQDDDINRPLISDKLDDYSGPSNNLGSNNAGESTMWTNRSTTSPRTHTHPTESHPIEGEVHVIDVTNGTPEELHLGSTLKRTAEASVRASEAKHTRRASGENNNGGIPVKDITVGSHLALEVIAGPSHGINRYLQSGNTSMLPMTLGRIPQSDLVLKDSEVSGKHARIDWNPNTLRWELVDMGSLNGTFLNSQAVAHPDVGSRRWSAPAELADGDIITLGSSSKVSVQISLQNQQVPVGVGMVSDAMITRRTGKKLPMEDVSCYQYPLTGAQQFGLFAIFDGHGGDGAAKAASRILPENVAKILSQKETIERVLTCGNASDVLKCAFDLTEAALNHQYEGCTATVLLIWFDQNKDCFAQCANLGDSACIMNVDGKPIAMTEDHRVVSTTERARIAKLGNPLKDGESRICGLNLCRMLGDKFLKEQDPRFSKEPYVSPVVQISKSCSAFALIASDGLWDVITAKKAAQLVLDYKERNMGQEISADGVADHVLSEARNLRTKDNTSVIFLDFDAMRTGR